ncbi:hypothetical protein QVZ41_02595 [Wenyingzhuangia sp. chi5]|uniref:Uncharacterized protein n=1 Tax=Wenyingzhuangia gilva TaxID=3057677 RepID=A0ABT8VP30_9FLAO|nr:hypothetical protein [Wenyingzhuangia sp. chi5]MDO3693735.1 hypothetical protein [Wenyingzhuangia sp. chi5]
MKKKSLIFVVTLLCVTKLFSQSFTSYFNDGEVGENKNYIYFYKGDKKEVKGIVRVKSPFLGKQKVEADGVEYNISTVQFYKSGEDFYGNIYNATNRNSFARRILKGKVNYYESESAVYNAPAMGPNGQFMGGGGYSTRVDRYYNKGFGPMKKANYENLVVDLVDNQESLLLLQSYKKVRNREIFTYVFAAAATLGGLLTAFEGTGEMKSGYNFDTNRYETYEEKKIKPVNLTIGLLGLTTGIINYFTSKKKYRYLEDSIQVYNN